MGFQSWFSTQRRPERERIDYSPRIPNLQVGFGMHLGRTSSDCFVLLYPSTAEPGLTRQVDLSFARMTIVSDRDYRVTGATNPRRPPSISGLHASKIATCAANRMS